MSQKSSYDDIVSLPHYRSRTRRPMSQQNRAAQFAPFAALTGYDSIIHEEGRLTDELIELDDLQKEELGSRIWYTLQHLEEHPIVTVTCFEPDPFKSGGSYQIRQGIIRRFDELEKKLIFRDGSELYLERIVSFREEVPDKE